MKQDEFIDPQIREQISTKVDEFKEHIDYYTERKRLIEEGLRSIGDVHSFWIENPELRSALLKTKSQKTVKEARKGIEAVKNGWHYLTTAFHPNVRLGLEHDKVKRLNRLITAPSRVQGNRSEDYRIRSVTLGFPDYFPPKHENVQSLMQEVFDDLHNEERDNLESAIYTHLAIAGIQPFDDGNKRTSRLIQDAILVESGYPPAIIYSGEGTFYFNLLHEALVAKSKDKVVGQRGFYDFVASKVNENS